MMLVASKKVAIDRLRVIVMADREAVPCGRWAKITGWIERYKLWQMLSKGMGAYARGMPRIPADMRPRYRWEVRR